MAHAFTDTSVPRGDAAPPALQAEVFDEDPVAVVTRDDPVAGTALRIARGKSVNGGQMCISPDCPRVPRESVDAFVTGVLAAYPRFYGGRSDGNPQVIGIVSDMQLQRQCAAASPPATGSCRCTSSQGPRPT